MSTPSRPPGPWARGVVYLGADSKEMSNVFWYQPSGTFPSDWNIATFGQAMYTQVTSAWQPILTTGVTIRGIYVEVNNGTLTSGYDYYSSESGNDITTLQPADIALVVQKHTASPGKAGRGRWYFGGLGQDQCTGSYLNSSGISYATAFAATLQTQFTDQSITWYPCHFSKKTTSLDRIVFTAVVAMLATRRRRRSVF
jgi:hypothetical protein